MVEHSIGRWRALWSHRVMWKCIDGVQRHRPQYDQHGIAKQSYIDAFIDACIALLLMAYDKLQNASASMLDLKPLADSLESYARSLETYARQIKSIGEILRSIEDQIEEQTHGAHNDSTRSTHASRTSTREPRLSPAADTKDHGEIRRYNAEGQTRGQTRLSHEFRQEAQTRQEAKLPTLAWRPLPVISDKLDTTPPVVEARAAYAPTADDPLNQQAMLQRIVAERPPPPPRAITWIAEQQKTTRRSAWVHFLTTVGTLTILFAALTIVFARLTALM